MLFWKSRKPAASAVSLFGFGKHPAWSEHQLDLGDAAGSQNLILLRDKLYFNGTQKYSTTWNALPPGSRCEFDHWLFWLQPGSTILARIIATADLSGRATVPFIVAAEFQRCPLEVVLRQLAPEFNEFIYRCLK